jgi:hypothetical protein
MSAIQYFQFLNFDPSFLVAMNFAWQRKPAPFTKRVKIAALNFANTSTPKL